MKERTLQTNIVEHINATEAAKVLVTHGLEAGTPDILGSINGQAVAIECKVDGEKPTKLQEHRLEEWRKAGAVAIVAREDFDVPKFVRRVLLGREDYKVDSCICDVGYVHIEASGLLRPDDKIIIDGEEQGRWFSDVNLHLSVGDAPRLTLEGPVLSK